MTRCTLLALPIAAAAGIAIAGDALAQQKTLKDQIVGTWTLTSWEQTLSDGKKLQRFGANPKGINIFEPNGRFVLIIVRPDIPKFASGSPMKTTPEENKAVVEGSIAYFGTYTIDEGAKTANLIVEASSLPNLVGIDQKRQLTSITADEMKYTNPGPTSGGKIDVAWKRVK